MKRTFLILSMMLLFVAGVMAQPEGGDRPNREEMQKKRMEMMKTELNLTADQVTKVTAIQADADKKMEAVFASGDRESGREKMKAIREDSDKKIKEVLTADQAKKWDEYNAKMRAERKDRRPEGERPEGGKRGSQRSTSED